MRDAADVCPMHHPVIVIYLCALFRLAFFFCVFFVVEYGRTRAHALIHPFAIHISSGIRHSSCLQARIFIHNKTNINYTLKLKLFATNSDFFRRSRRRPHDFSAAHMNACGIVDDEKKCTFFSIDFVSVENVNGCCCCCSSVSICSLSYMKLIFIVMIFHAHNLK